MVEPVSFIYMKLARVNCLALPMHFVLCEFNLAEASAGNNIAARMAMMAMTTSNSINVKPTRREMPAGHRAALTARTESFFCSIVSSIFESIGAVVYGYMSR